MTERCPTIGMAAGRAPSEDINTHFITGRVDTPRAQAREPSSKDMALLAACPDACPPGTA